MWKTGDGTCGIDRAGASHSNVVARMTKNLKLRGDPLAEPSFADKARETYKKVKSAAAKGLEAAREEYSK